MTKLPYIRAELATTYAKQEKGLMGRKYLPQNSGMLFDFKTDMPLTFWMKNTYIPLQIAFIDSSGKIFQISSMTPMSTKRIYSKRECRYALEVNDGWFNKNGIKEGSFVAHPSGEWPRNESNYGFFSFSQVSVPMPTPDINIDTNQQSTETTNVSPAMQILDSWLDIFKRADELGVSLIIEWQTKSGKKMPRTQISPPYEFGKTSEGDHNGLLIAWSDRDGHTISPIIENIIGVFDINGKSVNSLQELEQIGKNTPLTTEEEYISLGVQEQTINE